MSYQFNTNGVNVKYDSERDILSLYLGEVKKPQYIRQIFPGTNILQDRNENVFGLVSIEFKERFSSVAEIYLDGYSIPSAIKDMCLKIVDTQCKKPLFPEPKEPLHNISDFDLEYALKNNYPITITNDRYGARGEYLAFPLHHNKLPTEPFDSDEIYINFWEEYEAGEFKLPIGSGHTPQEAFEDLLGLIIKRLHKKQG